MEDPNDLKEVEALATEALSSDPEITMLRESYLPELYRLHAPHFDPENGELEQEKRQCDSTRCRRRWQRAKGEEARGTPHSVNCRSWGLTSDAADELLTEWSPLFRCRDCFGGQMLCLLCLHDQHQQEPFHRIEFWQQATWFQRTTLWDTGFIWNVGHQGHQCPVVATRTAQGMQKEPNLLRVVHINGMHDVRAQYCECRMSDGIAPYQQLLAESVFPATHDRPATAYTFQVLKTFILLNHAAKTPVYEYHRALVHMTDAVQPATVRVCPFTQREDGIRAYVKSDISFSEHVQELLRCHTAMAYAENDHEDRQIPRD